MRVNNDGFNVGASFTTDFDFEAMPLEHIANFAIQIKLAAGGSCDLSLQVSCDPYEPNLPTLWTDVSGSSRSVSGSDDITWTVENAGYNWVRVVARSLSGTITVQSARINVKGV